MSNVVAIARSSYHLKLLRANVGDVDSLKILSLSPSLASTDRHIGTEQAPSRLTDWGRAYRYNRHYYASVADAIAAYAPARLILFQTYTPLAKYLLGSRPRYEFELWEDGLNFYLEEHNGLVFHMKSFAKIALGCSSREWFRVYSSRGVPSKDRFHTGSLQYTLSPTRIGEDASPVFFGQPLVEDHFVSRARYIAGLKMVADRFSSGRPLVYLPHPREKFIYSVQDDIATFARILRSPLDAETAVAEMDASCFISAFSTVNVNIAVKKEKNYYCPSFFGLSRIRDKLVSLPFLEVTTI